MPDPETRHTETLAMETKAVVADLERALYAADQHKQNHVTVSVLRLRALLSEVATLRAEIARLRPYEAFVAAINAAEVLTVEPFFVWTEGPEGPTQVNVTIKRRKREGEVGSEESTAPDALRAWAKARGTDA